MIERSPTNPQLDRVFFALSDPTRRAIVGRLARGSTTVGELAAPFAISAPAVSKHMKVLERAGLVRRRIEGRRHRCSLDPRALGEARDWLGYTRDFWESRLDELADLLEGSLDEGSEETARHTTPGLGRGEKGRQR